MLHHDLTKSLGLLRQSVARCTLVHSQTLKSSPIILTPEKVQYVILCNSLWALGVPQ